MRTLATTLPSCILVLFLYAIMNSAAFSQGVTTAGINGRVTTKSGELLPGANIVAVHNPSGSKYGTSSRSDGRFNLPNLRVGGPYTISASIVGYQRQERTNIYLRLSENLDLNFTLAEEAVVGQEVVVVGQQSHVFNASRTGAATNVVRDQIDRLPTLSRNFQDYYKLSPYFAPSTVTGGSGNVLGRNSKYSNIQIDGTNFNDLFGLGSTGAPAGQSNVTPISLDAIEEFQLVVSPFDVRQTNFTGAGINVITRSGTNNYHGSGFYYGRNESIAGKNPTNVDSLKTKLAGFTDYQLGGRVGGPIIENQLFFFANGELTRFKQPFTRTFGNAAIGTNAYTANADSLQMVVDKLKNQYGYDPGSFTNIGYNRESDKLFLRFDYNLTEGHKVSARWNYLRSSEDNSPSRGRSSTDIYFDNGKYKLDDKTHSVALQLTSVFSNSSSNEFTLGYVDQKDVPVYYGAPFPTLYIGTSSATNTALKQNLVLGAEEFRHFNLLSQKYFEITDNFSWYLPEHTLTVGGKVDLFKFRNLFIPDAFGAYTYTWIADFLKSVNPPASYSFRYSATANPQQEANWGATQYGLYAQDEWTVNPQLKLTLGVRADIPTYPDQPNYNYSLDTTFFSFTSASGQGIHYRTDETPKTAVAFSPRLGFNWAIDEERNTQLRGGVGIFYGRFPYVWVSNQYSNTGVDFYTLTTRPAQFNPDPNNQTKPATATLPSAEVDLTDRTFKAPSIFRYSLAVDHKLPFDLVATVEGIFSTTQNDVYYQNINLKGLQDNTKTSGGATRAGGPLAPGGKIVGENREVWGLLRDSTAYTVQWVNTALFAPGVFLVRNTDQGFNSNITVQIQRNAMEGLNGTFAYTWGMAKDINSGNSTTASSGWRFNPTPGNPNNPQLTFSQWDRRHRLLGALSYREDWGGGFATTFGLFYNGQSGRPFSYMVTGDVNGDGRSDNDLVYIPKDANDIILMGARDPSLPISSSNPLIKLTDKTRTEYTQLMAYIDADDYLKEHKGQMSERSGVREPWAHQIDFRISQEIPTIAGQKVEVTLDILNILNLFNSDWGWVRNVGINQTVNLLTFNSLEARGTAAANPDYGKPRYQWTNQKVTDGKADPFTADNIFSRYQMQLGIRYTF